MRVFFSNLGCKLNQAELENVARQFVNAGHQVAASLAEADLHVVNSCTVTHVAARDSRKIARRGRRRRPEMKTVLTGCYVDGSPREAEKLAGVDLLVPNAAKDTLCELVSDAFPALALLAPQSPEVPCQSIAFGNTRPLVKIEDGCNMACAFCIIPRTRGGQRSRPAADILAEVESLVAGGALEIVLTGVQISSYERRGVGLFELVSDILDRCDVARLRLTSIAPWQFDRRILGLVASGRICRHFHLSLQSGCDATLRRMRRPYRVSEFAGLLREIRQGVAGVAITTDVIVGFPGESEAEFEESCDRIENLGFARIHAFPFSPRQGTAAAGMPAQVPPATRRRRMHGVLDLGERASRTFAARQMGAAIEVLWEQHRADRWTGLSDNYLRVSTTHPQVLNTLSRAHVGRADGVGVAVAGLPTRRPGSSQAPVTETPSTAQSPRSPA